jgi:hypothetical protein
VTAWSEGDFANVSSELLSSLGSSGVARDTLSVVDSGVILTMAFLGNPVIRGGAVNLEYRIVNSRHSLPKTSRSAAHGCRGMEAAARCELPRPVLSWSPKAAGRPQIDRNDVRSNMGWHHNAATGHPGGSGGQYARRTAEK